MATPSVDTDEAALNALRGAALRVTMPRRAVLAWLVEHPHSTVDAIGAGVREMIGTVSTQTVYDVLGACTDAGLLRRIEPAGHPPDSNGASPITTTTSYAGCAAVPTTSTARSGPRRVFSPLTLAASFSTKPK